jgi:hypothetical protein
VPCGRGNASGWQKEEPGWRHACGRRVFTLLDESAASLRLLPAMSSNSICIVVHYTPTLSDEDREIDPDRWCSHSAWGELAWQCVAQWVSPLRLELGHHLKPEPLRTTEFAPTIPQDHEHPCASAPFAGYGPPATATSWKTGRFSGQDFVLQPDGTLCCPAGQTLSAHERRREADGSLRVVYGASIRSCRPCPLREQCQWNGSTTAKPRQVSVLLHPLVVGSLPLLWCDWSRRSHRRACMQLLRNQCITIESEPPTTTPPPVTPAPFSRAQRAHSRLSWAERLARNARSPTSGQITIKLFGVPPAFAMFLDVPAIL